MHTTLGSIASELKQIAEWLKTNDPYSGGALNRHTNNWHHLPVSCMELSYYVSSLANRIEQDAVDDLGDRLAALNETHQAIAHFRSSSLQHLASHPQFAPGLFFSMIESVERSVFPLLKSKEAEHARGVIRAVNRLKSMEAQLNDAEPRTRSLVDMLTRIEAANEAADQLPADLDQLREARAKTGNFVAEAERDLARISKSAADGDELMARLKLADAEAAKILKQSGSAYAAATARGLAAAFAARSRSLSFSNLLWVFGLICALGLAGYMATSRLNALGLALLNADTRIDVVYLNLIAAFLSIGAPIWFAWLSTKQIGQNFKLSEDYAYKAAISQAYEGYRREANRIGGDLEARLLSSALQRLDEQPLRFVDPSNHGSPWQELLASEEVRSALKSVPGAAARLVDVARSLLKKEPSEPPKQ